MEYLTCLRHRANKWRILNSNPASLLLEVRYTTDGLMHRRVVVNPKASLNFMFMQVFTEVASPCLNPVHLTFSGKIMFYFSVLWRCWKICMCLCHEGSSLPCKYPLGGFKCLEIQCRRSLVGSCPESMASLYLIPLFLSPLSLRNTSLVREYHWKKTYSLLLGVISIPLRLSYPIVHVRKVRFKKINLFYHPNLHII